MNNKKIIQLIICLVLVASILCTLLFAGNESGTNTEAEQHFQRANELHISADYDAAITEYQAVIKLSPNSKIAQNAQYWIGQLYFEIRQFDAALSAFQKLLDEYPASTIIPSTKTMIERVQQAQKNRALFEAVKKADFEQVKQLIADGADIDGKWGDVYNKNEGDPVLVSRYGLIESTPLWHAVDSNNMEMVKLLVEEGADTNIVGSWPPLCRAVDVDNTEIAEYLIDHGANVNYPEDWGPLQEASVPAGYNIEMVELLIAKGADINTGDWPPLHNAVRSGSKEFIELLIQHGADINAKDISGWTPLYWSINNMSPSTDNENSAVAILNLLIANDADVNIEYAEGATALLLATRAGNVDAVKSLLEAGANINARNDTGQTALHVAVQNSRKDIVSFLLNTGIDINAKDNQGHTPLYVAVNNDYEVAELLINEGADSSIETESGQTLLQLAQQRKQFESIVPDKIFDGEPNSMFGYEVVCGDVDGDGYEDILIGETRYNNRQGRVYLFYGGSDIDTTADLIFEGQDEGDWFGDGIVCSDIDNDGYDDVVLGSTGRVYLYWGSSRNSMDNNPDKVFEGEQENGSYFGMSGLAVYDIDNDGYDDIILGASRGGSGIGRAYLYYGNTKELMDTSYDLIFSGEDSGGQFGISISCGDLDNDNYGDIIIGAWMQARAYLYYGDSKSNIDANADVIFGAQLEDTDYSAFYDFFGRGIVCVDQNRDGFDDVVIGDIGSNDGRGGTYLFHGNSKSSQDTDPDIILGGDVYLSQYGLRVFCGDIDGDDVDDLIISGNGPGQLIGKVYVYWGVDLSGPDPKPGRIFIEENAGDYFSYGLACGDVNNDGFDDLVVGAPNYQKDGVGQGRVYLYYGGPR